MSSQSFQLSEPSCVSMSTLQIGHFLLVASHWSTHTWWKRCIQGNRLQREKKYLVRMEVEQGTKKTEKSTSGSASNMRKQQCRCYSLPQPCQLTQGSRSRRCPSKAFYKTRYPFELGCSVY